MIFKNHFENTISFCAWHQKIFYLCWAVSVKMQYILTILGTVSKDNIKKKIAIFHARNIIITVQFMLKIANLDFTFF